LDEATIMCESEKLVTADYNQALLRMRVEHADKAGHMPYMESIDNWE